MNSLLRRVLSVVLIVLVLDQTLKIWVKLNMVYRDSIPLLGDWFELFFVENEGMAFGLKLDGDWGKLALSLFRVLAVVLIGVYLRSLIKKKAHKGMITAIAFIFAGALGNIIDSMFYGVFFTASSDFTDELATVGEGYSSGKPMGGFLYGKVVDMLHLNLHWPEWVPWLGGGNVFGPIFNIADVAISVGVAMIIIKQRTYFGGRKKKKKDDIVEEVVENKTEPAAANPVVEVAEPASNETSGASPPVSETAGERAESEEKPDAIAESDPSSESEEKPSSSFDTAG